MGSCIVNAVCICNVQMYKKIMNFNFSIPELISCSLLLCCLFVSFCRLYLKMVTQRFYLINDKCRASFQHSQTVVVRPQFYTV